MPNEQFAKWPEEVTQSVPDALNTLTRSWLKSPPFSIAKLFPPKSAVSCGETCVIVDPDVKLPLPPGYTYPAAHNEFGPQVLYEEIGPALYNPRALAEMMGPEDPACSPE